MALPTGAIRLAGLFPNPDNVLRPGQYGRVRFVSYIRPQALLVPQKAVTELQGIYQVAVVGADSKVNIRAVRVGERSGDMWIIEEGLKPGERVVTEGVQRAREGVPVKIVPHVLLKVGRLLRSSRRMTRRMVGRSNELKMKQITGPGGSG